MTEPTSAEERPVAGRRGGGTGTGAARADGENGAPRLDTETKL
nr:hypothetical protein [Actinomyces sp.]